VGPQWVERFLKRNSQYYRRKQKPLAYDRKNSQEPATFMDHFYKYKRAMEDHGILNEDVWNMNETGFRIGCGRAQMIVTLDPKKPLRMTDPDNRIYITSVECVSSRGWVIRPVLILAGVHILHKWGFDDLDGDIVIGTSETGYSNDDLAMDWLKHFIEHTERKRIGAWIMLIVDGFGSHMTIPFLNLCTEQKIVLYKLPPHSTHLTQPLDVGVFQPFKHYHTEAIDQAVRLGDYNFGKLEFLAAFQTFRNQTFKDTTIRHAFEITGLVSYNPEVVMEKVRANQLRRALRTSSPPPPSLFHTSKGPDSIIEHDKQLRLAYVEAESYKKIPSIHLNRFIRGVICEAHKLSITERDLLAIQEAATSRSKHDNQPGTVAAKFGVVKLSDCRELASCRAIKEAEKAERAEKRKQKAAEKKNTDNLRNIEFLLS